MKSRGNTLGAENAIGAPVLLPMIVMLSFFPLRAIRVLRVEK